MGPFPHWTGVGRYGVGEVPIPPAVSHLGSWRSWRGSCLPRTFLALNSPQPQPPKKTSASQLSIQALHSLPITPHELPCLPLSLLHLQTQLKCSPLFQQAFLELIPSSGDFQDHYCH